MSIDRSMIERIVRFSLKQRLFVVIAAFLIAGAGYLSYKNLAIDVFPDPSPPLVQIYSESHGMAPEEIERFLSYPIEASMFGLPRVKNIRSVSTFGLSIVNVFFEEGTDIYWARQLVSERLLEAREDLPEAVHNPVLGPIATGLGLVYLYYLEAEGVPIMELRTLQDWLVKFELKSIPDVSQVLSIGGDVKQFQIQADPLLLLKYDLTVADLVDRVKKNNRNVGAGFITRGKEEAIVRSIGLVQSVEDLRNSIVTHSGGTPIRLRDVAEVDVLPAIKRGTALANGEGEKVVGMVMKLFDSNTARVIQDLEDKIASLNRTLPEGIRIVPFYNQASLVKKCFSTVSTNLIIGIILIIGVLFLFMGDFPSAVIVVLSLPFSILFVFILMHQGRIAADLISFGGLAIAIGLIADAAIIQVENIQRRRLESGSGGLKIIIDAAQDVGRPLFFAVAIIILVFLPIFTLSGVEGIMFRPMGFAISFALAGSLLYALIVAPVIASYLPQRTKVKKEPLLIRTIRAAYLPFFSFCRRHKKGVFSLTILLFLTGLAILPFLGREYIPTLEEGTLHLRATFDPNISLGETVRLTTDMEKVLMRIPEVTGVLSRIGRGEVGSHAHFVNDAEILINYRPVQKWKAFKTKNEFINEIEHRLERFPGLNLNMTQPIAHNLDELLTGVKAQLAVKLYGENFDVLKQKSAEIRDVLAAVDGAADVQVEQFSGQNHIQIELDRERMARYGLDIQDAQDTIEAALGGIVLGQIYEEQKRFDIFLRLQEHSRKDVDAIENLLIPIPEGGRIPLSQIAAVREIVGPRLINREGNKRYITIQCNIRGRDIGRFVDEAQGRVSRTVSLPPEYLTQWGGQFELQKRANRRFAFIMPITLAVVIILLFSVFYSFREVLVILINIPLALTGGLIALKLSGLYLSVPASIGFIAIFGIALEDGLVLMSAFHKRLKSGASMAEAVQRGIETKLRPVLMTTFTTIFGVLPLLLSSGPGAEIQRPLGTVVVGGLLTSTLVTLVILPLVYESLKRRT